MRYLRVAKRYAKALLGISVENSIHERVYNDMKIISKAFSTSADLRVFIKSPIVRESKKLSVLKILFEKQIDPFTLKYLDIIVRKNRAILIHPIALQYSKVYDNFLGIEKVEVIAATNLDEMQKEKVLSVAKKISDKKIVIEEQIDKGIIGGFILQLGGYQYDASIRKKIKQLKKHLGY